MVESARQRDSCAASGESAILAGMDVHAVLDADCAADTLFRFVDDLARYPSWVDLVHRADPLPPADDGNPQWDVELRARVGPFARSKRLRMRRTVHDQAVGRVVFERAEVDGRRHSPWVLSADLGEHGGRTRLEMHLHYGGGLWTGGVLEKVLAEQISAGRERLVQLATAAD